MKLGRIILTFREDLIPVLKEYYLDGGRTDFLVIAYNPFEVDPSKFKEASNFRLTPYYEKVETRVEKTVDGQQFRVWVKAAKEFPNIEGWVIHDYDLACKPDDKTVFSHVQGGEYGIIGKTIPVWQDGMKEEKLDMFPFTVEQKKFHKAEDFISQSVDSLVDNVLMDSYPYFHQGVKTVLGGFGDFIAISRDSLLLLDDDKIKNITRGGNEQVPFTILAAHKVNAVDMRDFFSTKIFMDYTYLSIDAPYDLLNPVKYWPHSKKPTLKASCKNAVKRFLHLFTR
jgi:hypothetical protein